MRTPRYTAASTSPPTCAPGVKVFQLLRRRNVAALNGTGVRSSPAIPGRRRSVSTTTAAEPDEPSTLPHRQHRQLTDRPTPPTPPPAHRRQSHTDPRSPACVQTLPRENGNVVLLRFLTLDNSTYGTASAPPDGSPNPCRHRTRGEGSAGTSAPAATRPANPETPAPYPYPRRQHLMPSATSIARAPAGGAAAQLRAAGCTSGPNTPCACTACSDSRSPGRQPRIHPHIPSTRLLDAAHHHLDPHPICRQPTVPATSTPAAQTAHLVTGPQGQLNKPRAWALRALLDRPATARRPPIRPVGTTPPGPGRCTTAAPTIHARRPPSRHHPDRRQQHLGRLARTAGARKRVYVGNSARRPPRSSKRGTPVAPTPATWGLNADSQNRPTRRHREPSTSE